MKNCSLLGLTLAFFVLTGCQSGPFAKQQKIQTCPKVEVPACPVCEVQTCPPLPQVPQPPEHDISGPARGVQLIGAREWALVEPGYLVLEARVDTGAATSSIHAENIQLIEKDGKRWVRFELLNPQTGAAVALERRLHRRILVKQKTNSVISDRRYVVRMWLSLGDTRTWVDVSLSDRDDFELPLLIGRNMLMDNFVVDVSAHHTLPKPVSQTQAH